LNRFLETLKHYNEADYQRENLSKRFIEYNQQYSQTQKYLDTPFLWFAVDYFSHANLTLSLAKYDGKTFYEYMTRPLKRSTQSKGLFSLIKNSTSLMDFEWENLQVTSTRIDINLLDEHLIALNSVYKTIEELGVHSLNSTKLKKKIQEEISDFPYMRDLENFHRLMDSQWTLWFYPPAFDLNRIYIDFLIPNNSKITDFISFNDLRNTTLCNSRINRITGSKNEYSGYLTVPSRFSSTLKEIIDFNQEKENIIVKKYEEITMERLASSLALYDVKNGWKDSIPSYYKKILSKLKGKKIPIQKLSFSNYFITPKFNNAWNFKKFVEPAKLIQIYCKNSNLYSFDTLPLNKTNSNIAYANKFDLSDIGLIKYLYEKGVCRITYLANRLLYTYSPYTYEINCPTMSSDRIEYLISWIPYTRLFHTENHTFLWAFLTPKTAKWIRNKLKWPVRQIAPHHYPIDPLRDWYNFESYEWNKPMFLV